MKLAAAWTKRFTSRRDVGHFLAWLPDLREFQVSEKSDASRLEQSVQKRTLGKGITGLAAQMHEVQIGAPAFKTRQVKSRRRAPEEPQAVLAAPMLIADRRIGVLTAVSFEPGKKFTSKDATVYGRIAAVAGAVVHQSRQLLTMQALQSGQPLPRGIDREERLEREFVSAVTRLTQARPQAKAQVARLLTAVADLLEK